MDAAEKSLPEYVKDQTLGPLYRYLLYTANSFAYQPKWIDTEDKIALLLMILAVGSDQEISGNLTHFGGPGAKVFKYNETMLVTGMDKAVTTLFNMESHGVNSFRHLIQIAAHSQRPIWTEQTVCRLLELARTIPVNELVPSGNKPLIDESPGYQSVHGIFNVVGLYKPEQITNGAIKVPLLDFCRHLFNEFDLQKLPASSLILAPAAIFDFHASDDDIIEFYPRIRNLMDNPIDPIVWTTYCPRFTQYASSKNLSLE